jgi:hypothetical protein
MAICAQSGPASSKFCAQRASQFEVRRLGFILSEPSV